MLYPVSSHLTANGQHNHTAVNQRWDVGINVPGSRVLCCTHALARDSHHNVLGLWRKLIAQLIGCCEGIRLYQPEFPVLLSEKGFFIAFYLQNCFKQASGSVLSSKSFAWAGVAVLLARALPSHRDLQLCSPKSLHITATLDGGAQQQL